MKKWLLSLFCLLVVSVAAIPASAQTRSRLNNQSRRYYEQRVGRTYNNQIYSDSGYRNDAYNRYPGDYYYDNRSTWDRSRDKITTAIGAGAGAAIGAMAGGKRGAIIGAIAGGGGAALYTYGIRDKQDRY
ncbi:MAG TPA: hypothetical protein VLB68_32665 [Pyrinomonadaceae bacterium]|nr:hypothetical protein [Pyrinomonadaceae bacterium]